MMHIVLLSGGSGTRLWPLSNNARSKQFLKVLKDDSGKPISMVQRVFGQIDKIGIDHDVTIAANATQEYSIRSQVADGYELVVEPERRDTAPAIMLACAHLKYVQHASPEDTVVVMPIDTFASDAFYQSMVKLDSAVQLGNASIVLMGVEPTFPSEKYGYISVSDKCSQPCMVSSFTEKPTIEHATKLVSDGALWNCGVFGFKLQFITDIINSYIDQSSYDDVLAQYSLFPINSFDYEVVEKTSSIAVVPYSGTWKDLGTWNTLTEEMTDDCAGRVVLDPSCENVHVINETGLPMVVAGLNDAVVIATPDGILASGKEASARLKSQIKAVAESRPMYEQRQWGEYRVIDSSTFPSGLKSLSKVLIVRQGGQISYQKHLHRSEIWTVVAGHGQVVLDDNSFDVDSGSVIHIKPNQKHAVYADSELHIIEVQIGDWLDESDIERFGFFWQQKAI